MTIVLESKRVALVIGLACAGWEQPAGATSTLTEFPSAISIKLRAGQLTETHAKLVRKEFNLLAAGGLRLIPVSRTAFKQAGDLVKQQRYGLRAGDSLHLAVALELGASHMATLDGTLAEKAKRKGLKHVVF